MCFWLFVNFVTFTYNNLDCSKSSQMLDFLSKLLKYSNGKVVKTKRYTNKMKLTLKLCLMF